MAEFPNLAALRRGLTSDDADKRGEAYQAVYQADVEPSGVLGPDPDEEVVSALVDADVVPEDRGKDRKPAAELRQRQVDLLEEIRDALQGGS